MQNIQAQSNKHRDSRVKSKKTLTIIWICVTINSNGHPKKNAGADEQQNQLSILLHHVPLSLLTKFLLPRKLKGICSNPFLPSFNFSNDLMGLCTHHSQGKLASTNCQKNPKPQKIYLLYHTVILYLYIY